VVPAGLQVQPGGKVSVLPVAAALRHRLGYSPRKTRLATAIADMAFGQPA
jgi:hypothetical protein